MKKKQITLQNVKSFLLGNSRDLLDRFNLLPDLVKEQADYRALVCKDSCAKGCEYCGCSTPGIWFIDRSCNNGEKFPEMMNEEDWEEFKVEKKKYRKELLGKLIEHIDYYNNLSPFPLWDSYYTNLLKENFKMNKVDYDLEPVDCCKFCKNVHIIPDENGNDICSKCNNVVNDDYETFENIFAYIDVYGDIWGMKYDKDGEETSKHTDQ